MRPISVLWNKTGQHSSAFVLRKEWTCQQRRKLLCTCNQFFIIPRKRTRIGPETTLCTHLAIPRMYKDEICKQCLLYTPKMHICLSSTSCTNKTKPMCSVVLLGYNLSVISISTIISNEFSFAKLLLVQRFKS